MRKRIIPAKIVVPAINQLTGTLSKIGIILVILYFAWFSVASQVVAVDYKLPYPGMLPDSPLYFLKVARDQITLALITDKTQRAFYNLFLADKRLASGEMLWNQGKKDLATTTFLKGEEFFSEATNLASKLSSEDLKIKLAVAAAKHGEVLEKSGLDNAELQERTMGLLLKK